MKLPQMLTRVFILTTASSLWLCNVSSAHSGRTDSSGGHNGPGGYHSHNSGSGSSSGSSSSSRTTYTPKSSSSSSYNNSTVNSNPVTVTTVVEDKEAWAKRAYEESLKFTGAERISYVRSMQSKVVSRAGEAATFRLFTDKVAGEMGLTTNALLGIEPKPVVSTDSAVDKPALVEQPAVEVEKSTVTADKPTNQVKPPVKRSVFDGLKEASAHGTKEEFDAEVAKAKKLIDNIEQATYQKRGWNER